MDGVTVQFKKFPVILHTKKVQLFMEYTVMQYLKNDTDRQMIDFRG